VSDGAQRSTAKRWTISQKVCTAAALVLAGAILLLCLVLDPHRQPNEKDVLGLPADMWTAVFAFFQALGALLGIAVAIYVPYRLAADARRQEAKHRAEEAGALASIIFVAIIELEAKARGRSGDLGQGLQRPELFDRPRYWERLRLDVPPLLVGNLHRIHILGEPPAKAIAQAAAMAQTYDRLVDGWLHDLDAAAASRRRAEKQAPH
jgi:hypothetical protein